MNTGGLVAATGYDALWGDQHAIRTRAVMAVLDFEVPGGVSPKNPLTVARMLTEPAAPGSGRAEEGVTGADEEGTPLPGRIAWPQRFPGVRQYQAFFHDSLVQEAREQFRQALPRGPAQSIPWRTQVLSADSIASGLLRVCLRVNRNDGWLEAAGWTPPVGKGQFSPFPQEKSVALLSPSCRPFPGQQQHGRQAGEQLPSAPACLCLITRVVADAATIDLDLLVPTQAWVAMLEASVAAVATAAAPAVGAATVSVSAGAAAGSKGGSGAKGRPAAAPVAAPAAKSAYVRADGLLDSLLEDDDDEDEEDDGVPPPPTPPVATAAVQESPSQQQQQQQAAPPAEEWLYFWTLCSVVTNLREAEALYSLHTYDPRLVAVLLDPLQHSAGPGTGGVATAPRPLATSDAVAAAAASEGQSALAGVAGSRRAVSSVSAAAGGSSPGLVSFLTPALRRRFYPSLDYQRMYLHKCFNASQRTAINAAVLGDAALACASPPPGRPDTFTGYTLVQGPPGTGKSSTILGMINTLHLCAYNYYHETLLGIVSLEELLAGRNEGPGAGVPSLLKSVHGALQWLMTCATPVDAAMESVHTAVGMRPRLLVTAPSNAAVDNLVLRLHRDGLRGGVLAPPPLEPVNSEAGAGSASAAAAAVPALEVYHAPMLRVGDGAGPGVREACLHLEREVNRLIDAGLEAIDEALTGANGVLASALRDIDSLRRRYQAEVASVAAWAGISTSAPVAPASPAAAAFREAWLRYAGPLLTCVNNYTRARAAATRLRWARSIHEVPARERNAQAGTVRRELRNALLDNAELVFTTTASSALATLENFIQETGHRFDIVIVDEAGQAVEPSTLIPLRYGCAQAILVGDPFQLPPTVLSPAARVSGYARSLFARFMEAGHATHLLSQQYRSHPAVSAFPARYFYGGRVKDDASVCGSGRRHPLHAAAAFRPLLFYNVYTGAEAKGDSGAAAAAVLAKLEAAQGAQDGRAGGAAGSSRGAGGGGMSMSTYNEDEVLVVCRLLEALAAWRGRTPTGHRVKFTGTVGVISFYKSQVMLLKEVLAKRYGVVFQDTGKEGGKRQPRGDAARDSAEAAEAGEAAAAGAGAGAGSASAFPFAVEVNTVDAFQGQERDIIILSSVRTPAGYARASREERAAWVAADTVGVSPAPEPVVSGSDASDQSTSPCLLARVTPDDASGGPLPPWLPPGYVATPARRQLAAAMLAEAEAPAATIRTWTATAEALEAAVVAGAGSGGAAPPAAAGSSVGLGSVIGFVDDPRRMNVGLTRARFACWVVGHGPALSTSVHWRAFLCHAARSGAVVGVAGDPLQWVPPVTALGQ